MTAPQDTIAPATQPPVYTAVADTSSHSTPGTSSEYWVTRVVRQMQGCSPARIDSVIQANLPRREIRWSNRPDTLCIPGLEGRLPYRLPILEWKQDQGFFEGNRLLCTEMPPRLQGVVPETLARPYVSHDLLLSIIILCLAVVALLINATRNFLQARARTFFYSTGNDALPQHDKDTPPLGSVLVTYTLLCITGGLYALYYAQGVRDLHLCILPPHALLAVYTGGFALMFGGRRLLSSFINWIFFDTGSRRLWHLDYNFLLIAETVLLLPIVAIGICFDMPPQAMLLAGLAVVVVAKILLLYKAFAIFLPHFYGILHLLSYLCALEIMPCLALWVALHGLTDQLTITL